MSEDGEGWLAGVHAVVAAAEDYCCWFQLRQRLQRLFGAVGKRWTPPPAVAGLSERALATVRIVFRLSLELERVLMNVARKGEPKLRFDRLPVPFAMDYHKVSASHHVFHYESQLDFPAEAILSLFREFDLVAQWNRMCLETRILDEESDAHLLAFFRLWMPFPFAEREFVFECWGADLLDEAQAFVVLIGDGPRDATGLAGYPASSGKARPRINFLEDSAAVLFPKLAADGRSQTLVKTTLHVDLHIATPPQWLLEVVFKVIAPYMHKELLRQLHANLDPGPGAGPCAAAYAERLGARPLYRRSAARRRLFEGKVLDTHVVTYPTAAEEGLAAGAEPIPRLFS